MEEEGVLTVTKETFTQARHRNGDIPGYRAGLGTAKKQGVEGLGNE